MARGASGLLDAIARSQSARAERNRHRQRQRDERRRQRCLANNNSASNLANNSPAIPQVIESTVPDPSCQQQPSGQWVAFCPIKGSEPCSPPIRSTICITCIGSEHWPIRKIEQHLRMSWRTIKKYLEAPAQTPAARSRVSKLDPFKPTIAELLEKDARASAAVIEQRLRPLGYNGGHTILRDYIHNVRPQPQSKRAFVRMEPEAGERFEVDWGHFGALSYAGDKRKLYAFALVDAHSRMLVCRVHPQPEFRDLRPLPPSCFCGSARREPREIWL